MKPITETEKVLEREKILAKIAELRRDPDSMVTENMGGKMEGFNSLSSSSFCGNCPRRIEIALNTIRSYGPDASALLDRYLLPSKNRKHITGKKLISELLKIDPNMPICVCVFCYANRAQSWQDDARIKFSANHEILSELITDDEKLPLIPRRDHNKNQLFRNNAEGDCNSTNQALNEFRIAELNPDVRFVSWTKNPGYYERAYTIRGSKPENMDIILSSAYINQPDYTVFNYYDRKFPGLFKRLFTVLTPDYAEQNGIVFNCCTSSKTEKKCKNCKICYTDNNVRYIWEILR